ncbi:hypothetical protein N7586_15475 [Acinetobacter ursingii]|nr:hypothetical protein [Acinetobacter ursingii]MDG9993601.1 hypothetical protein [Acinetobacter ursingii]MDH0206006.1 hypothetical protein [Acinetobacter ursingii]
MHAAHPFESEPATSAPHTADQRTQPWGYLPYSYWVLGIMLA